MGDTTGSSEYPEDPRQREELGHVVPTYQPGIPMGMRASMGSKDKDARKIPNLPKRACGYSDG